MDVEVFIFIESSVEIEFLYVHLNEADIKSGYNIV